MATPFSLSSLLICLIALFLQPRELISASADNESITLPVRIHRFRTANEPRLNCSMSDDDIREQMKAVNETWKQASIIWAIELGRFTSNTHLVKRFKTNWSLCGILPKAAMLWKTTIPMSKDQLAVRVINPMPNGIPLTFANDPSLQMGDGWLLLPKQ